jgi:hypothetical protein
LIPVTLDEPIVVVVGTRLPKAVPPNQEVTLVGLTLAAFVATVMESPL